MPKNLFIAQISDLHVVPRGQLASGAADTVSALCRLVERLRFFTPALDAVIVTGDLADNGEPEAYEILSEVLSALPCPVLAVPGNHDDKDLMARHLGNFIAGDPLPGGELCASVTLHGHKIILLDSAIKGAHGGGMSESALDWLEKALPQSPSRPTLIAIHHPPFRSGLGLMDEKFKGSERLGELLSKHPQALLGCGHLHFAMAAKWKGGQAVICPSVLAMELEIGPAGGGAFSLGPPVHLLHHLTGAGINTHFRRIPGKYPHGGPYLFSGCDAGLPSALSQQGV